MKSRTWQFVFRAGLGLAIALISATIAIASVDAQSFLRLLPKYAIAPPVQIDSLKSISTSLDGFIPKKLQQSASPTGDDTRGIIGLDQRLPMMSREYPWSTVGKIVMLNEAGDQYSCTGTLIEKSLVLTNAHCVYDKDKKLFQKILFLPNLINGSLRTNDDMAGVKNVLTGTNSPDDQPDSDWAILELDKPSGEKYGFLKWRSVPVALLQSYKNKFSVAGYSGDYPDPKVYSDLSAGKGYTAGVHEKCSVLSESDGMLVHDCDTNFGASGSAVIGKIDGVYQIVGLHAGGSRDRDGRGLENYAVRIGRIEAELNKGN